MPSPAWIGYEAFLASLDFGAAVPVLESEDLDSVAGLVVFGTPPSPSAGRGVFRLSVL